MVQDSALKITSPRRISEVLSTASRICIMYMQATLTPAKRRYCRIVRTWKCSHSTVICTVPIVQIRYLRILHLDSVTVIIDACLQFSCRKKCLHVAFVSYVGDSGWKLHVGLSHGYGYVVVEQGKENVVMHCCLSLIPMFRRRQSSAISVRLPPGRFPVRNPSCPFRSRH